MENDDGKAKGMIFRSTKRWILETYGEDGFRQFLEHIPQDERRDWQELTFLPSTFVPARYYQHMYEAITSLWGKDDPMIFRNAAGTVAFYDINRVFNVILRISSPSFVAKQLPLVWKRYFTSGSYVVTKMEPNGFEAEIRDADVYGIAGCEGPIGWSVRALTYSGGAKNLVADQYECKFKGGQSCKIRYTRQA